MGDEQVRDGEEHGRAVVRLGEGECHEVALVHRAVGVGLVEEDAGEHALPREVLEPEPDALLWQAVGGEQRKDVVRVLGAAGGIY